MHNGDRIKVSVLTYVKNDKDHIEECMRSVMAQDLKEMEYLVIDGGSTDGTRDIIRKLADEDNRIRIIDTDPGLGHQFNVGLKEARGEYIGICESDDYLLPGMYSFQYEIARSNDVDILRADAYDFFGDGIEEVRIQFRLPGVTHLRNRLLTGKEVREAFNMGVNRFFSGLYKRSFIINNELFMNETPGAAYQDNTFAFITLIKAEKIFISDAGYYCYRLDNPNASCNSPDRLNLVDTEYRLMRERLIKMNEWENNKERYLSWMIRNHLWFCNLLSEELRRKEIEIFYRALNELISGDKFDINTLRYGEKELISLVDSEYEDFEKKVETSCHRIERAKNDIRMLVTDDKIVIFGCGNIGMLVYYTLKKRGIRPFCFLDNNRGLWGTYIEGVAVVDPKEVCGDNSVSKYIIANVEHNAEIRNQLIKYGIKEEKMIVCDSYDFTARKILMGVCDIDNRD